MNRLLASLWIAGIFLLSSCSSGPDFLYEIVDDLVVIDADSWSTAQDSQMNQWKSVLSDAGPVARLDAIQTDELPATSRQQPASVSYDIDFDESGLFYLWIRARLISDASNPTLTITISAAGENAGEKFAQQVAGFDKQWQWIPLDVNQNILSANITTSGLHHLSIASDSTALLVDKIILTTIPNFIPTGAGPDATLVQTEDLLSDNAETVQTEVLTAGTSNNNPINPVTINDSSNQQDEYTNRPNADFMERVNAGPEVQILHSGIAVTELKLQGTQLQLFAKATDDDLPTDVVYTYWTKVIGPGEVKFSDQTDTSPVISFSIPGIYKLQVSANDTELYKNAIVTVTVEAIDFIHNAPATEESVTIITVSAENGTDAVNNTGNANNAGDIEATDSTTETFTELIEADAGLQDTTPAIVNNAPIVSITGPTTAVAGQSIELTADTSTDQSNQVVHHYWNQVHGSGVATIANIQDRSTTVIFDRAGKYVLQVSASVNTSYANATIEIDVTEASNDESDASANQGIVDSTDNSQINQNQNQENIASAHSWQKSFASGSPQKRHETSGVVVNGKMYVIGGRGHKPVDVYDSASNRWSQAAKPPIEMHHFQAVAINNTIYVVGASTCCFPREKNIANVYEFDTQSGQWSKGAAIPANRQRGSAAAAVYNNKIYIVGGNTRGHSGGAVGWLDEYDPMTGKWRQLADAPDARDHATIAVVGNQLVVAGGRRSAYPDTFGNTVGRTNIYDLRQHRWHTAANIPTQRAGTMAVGIGSELVVIGGESKSSRSAHNAVEAFNIISGNWRQLSPLPTPRHGGAAAVIDNNIHVVAGSMQIGGAPETNAHEILKK